MHASALAYLKVCSVGAPAATLWLATNGIFRGLGDTATPLLWALTFTARNAVLAGLFIFPLGMGAAGAAAAGARFYDCYRGRRLVPSARGANFGFGEDAAKFAAARARCAARVAPCVAGVADEEGSEWAAWDAATARFRLGQPVALAGFGAEGAGFRGPAGPEARRAHATRAHARGSTSLAC